MAVRGTRGRSAEYAWLITGPLAIFTLIAFTVFWVKDPHWFKAWPQGLLLFGVFMVAFIGVFHFTIRRNVFSVFLTDIPLLLAFYYLPPTMVILMVSVASLIVQLRTKTTAAKRWFNLAKSAAGVTAAVLFLAALPDVHSNGAAGWLVLLVAVMINQLVEVLSIAVVMATVQSLRSAQEALRAGIPVLTISAVNVAVSLVILAALTATTWAIVPLIVLIVALALVRRSFTEFFRQHRTLADVYELTQAVRSEGFNALPDALLVRVQAVMRAEYATLWLAPQGRHPEVLLTAQVENRALLDLSPVPPVVRERAIAEGRAIAVGSRFAGTEDLRPALRDAKTKDVIVVPLGSGKTTIGTLEVVNRLGDTRAFRDADVQVLKTIAAHVAVAVPRPPDHPAEPPPHHRRAHRVAQGPRRGRSGRGAAVRRGRPARRERVDGSRGR
jgi:GAF domain-containing protein